MKRKAKELVVSVDRVEGPTVMLEGDDGRSFSVSLKVLGEQPREGMLYRVPLDRSGEPLWPQAVADDAAADRRKRDLDARMKALRHKDSGGDTKL